MLTTENITEKQIADFRDANLCGPRLRVARVALGQCCIPCVPRAPYGSVYAERCPTDWERDDAIRRIVDEINLRAEMSES